MSLVAFGHACGSGERAVARASSSRGREMLARKAWASAADEREIGW